MASDWLMTTLADVSSDIAYGYTESAVSEQVGPKFLRITDIQGGVVDWGNVPYCPISPNDHAKYRLEDGDLVIARTGNSTGENYLYRGNEDAVFASYLIRFRLDRKRVDARFVWYNLRTQSWWKFIASSKTGSAQAGANAKVLGRFPLPLLPLREQQAIACILGALDDKIELNRRMNKTLEEMTRAIFKSWFVDFLPVRAKMAARTQTGDPVRLTAEASAQAGAKAASQTPPLLAPQRETARQAGGLTPEIAALFPDSFEDSELGQIPKGWKVGSILKQARLLSGGTPKTALPEYWNGGIQWASAKDISQCDQCFLITTERTISKLGLEKSSTQIIPAYSTAIVARGATTGRMVMFGSDIAMNQTCYALYSSLKCNFALYCQVNHIINDLVQTAHGSVFDTITTNTFQNLQVVLPSPKLLEQFESIAAPLFECILSKEKQSLSLVSLHDTLLPKLIAGEIRVSDAEQIIGRIC